MPASSGSTPAGAPNDIWHQHEARIKDLYQDQRKTLPEVKKIMEESGFPETPLSTWESKLREELQLRKKAKSHDWPLIYRHVLPRLKRPGKKQLKKDTVIRLSGSEIPWDKAWKEIRRSGATKMEQDSTVPSPLPPEVTVRSPSPVSFASSPTLPAAQPAVSHLSTLSSETPSLALVPLQTSGIAPLLQRRSLTYSFSVYLIQWCASNIPWLEWCQSVQNMFRDGKHTRQLEFSFSSVLNEFLATSATARAVQSQIRHGIMPSDSRLDLLRDDRLLPPRPSPDLGYRVARSGGRTSLSQFISTAIFLLSNRLHDWQDGDQGLQLLCSLLDSNAFLITTLLQSHEPSIRAAWEALHMFVMRQKRKDTFQALTNIGIHNHWLSPGKENFGNDCLRSAVEMGCYDLLCKMVVFFCRSTHSTWWRDSLEAIRMAYSKGNAKCASLLARHCNVNARGVRSRKDPSMFQELVSDPYLESNNDQGASILELFLSNGANVDESSANKRITRKWKELVGGNELFKATRPTILDEIFYLHRSFFTKARTYSKVPVSRISRTGLLLALEEGSQTLREYLSTREPRLPSFDSRHVQSLLELMLAEQFFFSKMVDVKIVQSLLQLGVDLEMPSVQLGLQDFWRIEETDRTYKAEYFDFDWHQFDSTKESMGLLNMLLAQGGVIGEHVLAGVVAHYGTAGLKYLTPHLTAFSTRAVRALVRAARLNNFEDVEVLFRMGVDPSAFVTFQGQKYSIQAVASQSYFTLDADGSQKHFPDSGSSLEMIKLLAQHGARLVVTPEDSPPFDFAKHLIRFGQPSDLLAKTKYVLGTIAEDKTSSRLPSFLLESCPTRMNYDHDEQVLLEVFEYLFRQGAEVSPGSPLAALVDMGGREELVRDVLYSGSDLNAYWTDRDGSGYTPLQMAALQGRETLVRLFLREGANANSPACIPRGMTALQAICGWSPATEEEHQRNMRICLLLIEQGADVNAPPSDGWTALSSAAFSGDLELAALFLREGADVNATYLYGTALDVVAFYGRLDMVKFLLCANGLSGFRGATGYDGAIYKAEQCGHLAVADLIREHAAKVKAGTVFNPELLKPQEKCRVRGFGRDDDSSSDSSESSSDDDDDIAMGPAVGICGPVEVGPGYMDEAAPAVHGDKVFPGGGQPSNSGAGFVLSQDVTISERGTSNRANQLVS